LNLRVKPKAARFGTKHAGLATKAASQLQLRVLLGNDPKVAALVARLPVGRVHATGRMFVPFVRRDLYDKLLAAAPAAGSQQQGAPPPSGSSGRAGSGGKPAGSPPNLPRTWEEIGIGDIVVAFEDADEGWYEAIVAEAAGDMLTLRWRDYPRQRQIVRHRNRLGLLHGPSAASPASNKAGKPTTAKGIASAADSAAEHKGLPPTWDELDAGHLVLAKTDGPWGSWWEAIVIAKDGDQLTLRWRDNHANVPPITRTRFDVALIRPDAV
jgi:Agenet domain